MCAFEYGVYNIPVYSPQIGCTGANQELENRAIKAKHKKVVSGHNI